MSAKSTYADKNMEAYVERIKTNAEHLAKDIFPKKALELDELVNGSTLDTANLSKVSDSADFPKPEDFILASAGLEKSDLNQKENVDESMQSKKRKYDHLSKSETEISGTKVILFPGGAIKSNQTIIDLLKHIKPYVIHFLDSSAMLKLWIQILIPQIEDFKAELSLQIQEESLAEIRAIESEVATYLDHIYKYYAVRGKLVAKFAKYPHVHDYKQSILELDEKMFMTARLIALELRNHYTSVHDILIKNLEKIKKPRSDHTISMY
ncbi:proteasome activator complex subunit 3 isoform X1 [Brachionus plicatilis]|uniref:Proteasome activator complex subunit 3 isoform X1 n=1 Tax=Brachionus plicatilis TaxID=10195 RepID=A0A3M7SX13_BRAPC|nr:proteasome activator complex subunit 3 isoform X1 [Brachionus plicatilis]